jgi:hypothetical protein
MTALLNIFVEAVIGTGGPKRLGPAEVKGLGLQKTKRALSCDRARFIFW